MRYASCCHSLRKPAIRPWSIGGIERRFPCASSTRAIALSMAVQSATVATCDSTNFTSSALWRPVSRGSLMPTLSVGQTYQAQCECLLHDSGEALCSPLRMPRRVSCCARTRARADPEGCPEPCALVESVVRRARRCSTSEEVGKLLWRVGTMLFRSSSKGFEAPFELDRRGAKVLDPRRKSPTAEGSTAGAVHSFEVCEVAMAREAPPLWMSLCVGCLGGKSWAQIASTREP